MRRAMLAVSPWSDGGPSAWSCAIGGSGMPLYSTDDGSGALVQASCGAGARVPSQSEASVVRRADGVGGVRG